MNIQRVIITGFMGTGKSSVGKLVAERLSWLFFDTDALVETTEGLSIFEIFEKKGEDYFRKLESRCFEGLVSLNEVVIATGGGTLFNPKNLALASQDSILICLWASEAELERRLQEAVTTRPLLKRGFENGMKLLTERKPFYEKMGHQMDTTGLLPESVSNKILELIGAA